MKKVLFTLIIVGILINLGFSKNLINDSQVKVSEEFLSFLIKQDFESCWKLVDKKITKKLTKEQFISSLQQLYKSIPTKNDDFELYMNGVNFSNNSEHLFHSFKYKSDLNNTSPEFLIDIAFLDNKSELIAGIQIKGSLVAENESIRQAVVFNDKTLNINSSNVLFRSISITHINANMGSLAVRIERSIPSNIDKKEWTNKEGRQIIKHLINDDIYKVIVEKAKNLNIELLGFIEVSFLNHETKEEFATTIQLQDLK